MDPSVWSNTLKRTAEISGEEYKKTNRRAADIMAYAKQVVLMTTLSSRRTARRRTSSCGVLAHTMQHLKATVTKRVCSPLSAHVTQELKGRWIGCCPHPWSTLMNGTGKSTIASTSANSHVVAHLRNVLQLVWPNIMA